MNTTPLIFNSNDMTRLADYRMRFEDFGPATQAGIQNLTKRIKVSQIIEAHSVPKNVVTMNSVVQFKFKGERGTARLRLVYPDQSRDNDENVSVFSPLGMALLGQRNGARIEWTAPGGRMGGRIVAIEYQPEAHGHYHL